MTDERLVYSLLATQTLHENEVAAINPLLTASHQGEIRSVPDQEMQSR